MRTFKINKKNWPCGVSDGLKSNCEKCGKNPKWDFIVSDWLWKKVVPKKWQTKVVCFECFEKLCIDSGVLEHLGPELKFVQYTAVDQTIELIPANIFYYKSDTTRFFENLFHSISKHEK